MRETDDRLLDAGVPLPGGGPSLAADAVHAKVGLFNGKSVSTGSAKLAAGSRYQTTKTSF